MAARIVFIVPAKIQDRGDIGTAEAVDGLFGVPYEKAEDLMGVIGVTFQQSLEKPKLVRIRVLELIHEQGSKLCLFGPTD